MLPVKLKALNQESEDEDTKDEDNKRVTPELTKEALEQKAQLQYRNALLLQNSNQPKEAESALLELLQSDIMLTVENAVEYVDGMLKPSLSHLKYCCLVNIGNLKLKENNCKAALKYFLQAVWLDGTDLNLLYRIGDTALKLTDLNIAVTYFIRALGCSNHHWPSLNSLITASYAMLDFMTCLMYIAEALALDPNYMKAIAFREKIFEDHSTLKEDFETFHPELNLRYDLTDYDREKSKQWFEEVERLRRQDPSMSRKEIDLEEVVEFGLLKPLSDYTWIALGSSVLKLYKFLYTYYPHIGLFCKTDLNAVVPKIIKKWSREADDSAVDEVDGMDTANSTSELSEEQIDEYLSDYTESSESEKDQIVESSSRPKRRKASPTLAEQLRMCDKRRSSRNRTAVKSNEINLSKSLRNIIPLSLLPQKDVSDPTRWYDESLEIMDICRLFDSQEFLTDNVLQSHPKNNFSESSRNKLIKNEGYFGTDKEAEDVRKFIESNTSNLILDICHSYLRVLASKWRHTWSRRLYQMFSEIYRHLEGHGVCGHKIDNVRLWDWQESSYEEEYSMSKLEEVRDEVNVVLLYGELLIDLWYENITEAPPKYSLLRHDFNALLIGDLNDVCNLLHKVVDKEIVARAYWLEALLYLQEHNTGAAYVPLQMLQMFILEGDFEVRLPHMKNYYLINDVWVRRLLNTLQRHLCLQQVDSLFNNERYEDVVQLLQDALQPGCCNEIFILPDEDVIPRYKQYNLLLASFWEIKNDENFAQVFQWCEMACYEAFTMYRKCFFDESNAQDKACWSHLVINSLRGLFTCLETYDLSKVSEIAEKILCRLVQTLVNLICHQIEASDQVPEIMIDVITPWLILYNIMASRETNKGTDNGDWYAPPSVSLLFLAHEYLGRRNWCCFDDGGLLFYQLDILLPIFEQCSPDSEGWLTVTQQVEQIFYCLYAQPYKRYKARYVQEHNSLGLALTWNRAIQVYQFHKPRVLPMFDAVSKVKTISSDTEILLQRIVPLIPPEQNPARLMDSAMQYINGNMDTMPKNDNPLPPVIKDLFYLLADYHFKSKALSKALRYYMLDVCTNPCRVDSWAAMALARGSQLEMKINSCETIKNESDILTRIDITGRCFKTALRLDPSLSSLWIEYGVFTYSSHAFCSRLLKQETTNMSLQMFEMLETHKQDLINSSEDSFRSADEVWYNLTNQNVQVQDERWLHHYMLGKLAEKREDKCYVYLSHYYKAAELLFNNGAEYPEKITYSNPEYYSVEALEVHYRVHATILKILEAHEEKPLDDETLLTIEDILRRFEDSTFARDDQINETENIHNPGPVNKWISAYFDKVKQQKELVENKIANFIRSSRVSDNKRTREDDDRKGEKFASVKKIKLTFAKNESRYEDAPQQDSSKSLLNVETAPAEQPSLDNGKRSEERSASSAADMADPNRNKNTIGDDTDPSDRAPQQSSSDESSSDSESDSSSSSASAAESSTKPGDVEETGTFEKERESGNQMYHLRVEVQKYLTSRCLSALEYCVRRFPEHYKSLFRLSNHYMRSKYDKNLDKCKRLLLLEGGLFSDRKPSNFFHGIWRIPTAEVDRFGSFAFHMTRCVHLLMDVLRDLRDHKMLMILCIQLKDTPEPDKKYIRDNEREQLGLEIASVCAQVMRKNLESVDGTDMRHLIQTVLLDAYKCYLKISRNYFSKEAIYGKLLIACYRKCTGKKASLEQIVQFCKNLKNAVQAGAGAVDDFLRNTELPQHKPTYETTLTTDTCYMKFSNETQMPKMPKFADTTALRDMMVDDRDNSYRIGSADAFQPGVVGKCSTGVSKEVSKDISVVHSIKIQNRDKMKTSKSSTSDFTNITNSNSSSSSSNSSSSSSSISSNGGSCCIIKEKTKRSKDLSSSTCSAAGSFRQEIVGHLPITPEGLTITPATDTAAIQFKQQLDEHKSASKLPTFQHPPVATKSVATTIGGRSSSISMKQTTTKSVVRGNNTKDTTIDLVIPSVSITPNPNPNKSCIEDIASSSSSKERCSLIITPVTSSSSSGSSIITNSSNNNNNPTLQQKLAAKQHANIKQTFQQQKPYQHNKSSPSSATIGKSSPHHSIGTQHIFNSQTGLTIIPVVTVSNNSNNNNNNNIASTSSSLQQPSKHSVSISKVTTGGSSNLSSANKKNAFSLPVAYSQSFKIPTAAAERKSSKTTATESSSSKNTISETEFRSVIKNLQSVGTKLTQRKEN